MNQIRNLDRVRIVHRTREACRVAAGALALASGLLAAGAMPLLASAQAQPAGATTSAEQVIRVRATGAAAQFGSVDPTGCVSTSVSVNVSPDVGDFISSPARGSRVARISMFRFDRCALTFAFADGIVHEPQVEVSKDLSAAHFSGPVAVEMIDGRTRQTVTLSVDVRWTGTSDILTRTLQFQARDPELGSIAASYDQRFRHAQAAGTITCTVPSGARAVAGCDGTTNLATQPDPRAEIQDTHDGRIEIRTP